MPVPADDRYARQLRLPGFGRKEQERLGRARVAVLGAGGLGSPALAYLAAAGVGTREAGGWITVIDADRVDASNLHRQVIHGESSVGNLKAESACARMRETNPEVDARPVAALLTTDDALDILAGHDIVLDGTDNFPTRYLASDACELLDIALVWGSILAYEGQLSVFHGDGGRGVTYRDVHPVPPGPGQVPNCAEAGVLGMLCGIIGSAMALEAVKVIAGIGEPLLGTIALFDALTMRWTQLPVRRSPDRAPVTGLEDLTITCGLPGPDAPAPAYGPAPAPLRADGGAGARPGAAGGAADGGAASAGAPAGEGVSAHVSPEDLPGLIAGGTRVIDIREDDEVASAMVAGAEHIASGTLLASEEPSEFDGAVLYCAAGKRSEAARRALEARGVKVGSVDGGIAAIRDATDLVG